MKATVTRTIPAHEPSCVIVAMSIAATSEISRRMTSIAGRRNSNPNGCSDGVPQTESKPTQAAAPGRLGIATMATVVARVTRSPTPDGVNLARAIPDNSHAGSVARCNWASQVQREARAREWQADHDDSHHGGRPDGCGSGPMAGQNEAGLDLGDLECANCGR